MAKRVTKREHKQLMKLRREWEVWHRWVHNSDDLAAQFQRLSLARLTGDWRHDKAACDVCKAKAESP